MSLGALCALWVVGPLVAPRASRADCAHPDRPSIGIAPEGGPLAATRAEFRRDVGATSPRTPPRPPEPGACTGPQCSGKSAPAPSSAATPRISVAAEAWAWLAAIIAPADARSAADWPEPAVARPAAIPSSIFHPPRRPR